MSTNINLEKYTFFYDTSVKVEYSEGGVIDLGVLNVVSVCITKDETGFWAVNIITRESLYKLKKGITKTLETPSFKFKEYMNAILAHNFLTLYLLAPESQQENT